MFIRLSSLFQYFYLCFLDFYIDFACVYRYNTNVLILNTKHIGGDRNVERIHCTSIKTLT